VRQGGDRGVEALQSVGSQATARAVSFARGPAIGCLSVNVVLGQPGSGHRQTRLARSNRTGLPKQGMSCSRTRRRPWPTATTPQSGQPVTFSPVSTPEPVGFRLP
jgi:hypothetical protein